MYLGVLAGGGGSFTFSRPTLGGESPLLFLAEYLAPPPGAPAAAPPPPAPDPPGPHRSDINIPLRFSKVYFTSKL